MPRQMGTVGCLRNDYDDLRSAADRAMLSAKRRGRNNFTVATESAIGRRGSGSDRFIEGALWGALERGELRFDFQPQRRLADSVLSGYEALLRWSGQRGPVSPGIFIPALVRIGAMPAVTKWSVSELCRVAKRSNELISMNVSPAQLEIPGFVGIVKRALAEHDLSPCRFEFEVIEQRLPEEERPVLSVLDELARLGVGIALDDFGKGFSSFERLERIPISKIKLDKSLSFRDGAVTKTVPAIVKLASLRGIPIVAEGIETSEQLVALADMGVSHGQGFFLGRPAPLEAASPASP